MKDLLGERMESIHMAHFTPHQLSLLVLILLHHFLALRSHPPSFILYIAGEFSPTVTLSQPSLPRHTQSMYKIRFTRSAKS